MRGLIIDQVLRHVVCLSMALGKEEISSLNGYVTSISMDTGKILDVESLSKVIVTKCQSLLQFATLLDAISNSTIMKWTVNIEIF